VAMCLLMVVGTSLLTQKLGFSDTVGGHLWLQMGLWLMCGMEGAIVALLLHLVMVATGLVANAWDGGCHCRPPLAVGHGCN
jgi:hypothetical protein